ncbi:MAG TPA: hypothetical protein VFP72_24950 [Kineosporiaceae bacterium]|nr:hypothetical protein [Kineosporiaceae bacterium]
MNWPNGEQAEKTAQERRLGADTLPSHPSQEPDAAVRVRTGTASPAAVAFDDVAESG